MKEGVYICTCGHRAEDHAGLCLTRCREGGCACQEYVRDWRSRDWAREARLKQGTQIPLCR